MAWSLPQESVGLKLLLVAVLILVLLIPLSMIRGVIGERQGLAYQAEQSVMSSWGYPQTVAGPVLAVPYEVLETDGKITRTVTRYAHWLPATLSVAATLDTEERYRGIYNVPVYTADMTFQGKFDPLSFRGLPVSIEELQFDKAILALPLSDARPIKNDLSLQIGESRIAFEPSAQRLEGFEPVIAAELQSIAEDLASGFDFNYRLRLSGAKSLKFLPVGNFTEVELSSRWASPSFVGAYLPDERDVNDEGFSARWSVQYLGRGFPSRWSSGELAGLAPMAAAFGVDLFVPVSRYQVTERATKYGLLFLGLSFTVFFLFEVMAKLRLHPLQYLLVGFGNCLFYLLLLALSEHMAFGAAFGLSALATVVSIAGYSTAVLGGRARGLALGGLLSGLYGFLYFTILQETYAMLSGALALFATLTVLMYVTRKIDWYAVGGRRAAG